MGPLPSRALGRRTRCPGPEPGLPANKLAAPLRVQDVTPGGTKCTGPPVLGKRLFCIRIWTGISIKSLHKYCGYHVIAIRVKKKEEIEKKVSICNSTYQWWCRFRRWELVLGLWWGRRIACSAPRRRSAWFCWCCGCEPRSWGGTRSGPWRKHELPSGASQRQTHHPAISMLSAMQTKQYVEHQIETK